MALWMRAATTEESTPPLRAADDLPVAHSLPDLGGRHLDEGLRGEEAFALQML